MAEMFRRTLLGRTKSTRARRVLGLSPNPLAISPSNADNSSPSVASHLLARSTRRPGHRTSSAASPVTGPASRRSRDPPRIPPSWCRAEHPRDDGGRERIRKHRPPCWLSLRWPTNGGDAGRRSAWDPSWSYQAIATSKQVLLVLLARISGENLASLTSPLRSPPVHRRSGEARVRGSRTHATRSSTASSTATAGSSAST
jgi:hypothetical protein